MGCDLYIGVHYTVVVTRWQSVDDTSTCRERLLSMEAVPKIGGRLQVSGLLSQPWTTLKLQNTKS